jgi:hypothetical protein
MLVDRVRRTVMRRLDRWSRRPMGERRDKMATLAQGEKILLTL